MNNELYHYGVKGMKWGVRHDSVLYKHYEGLTDRQKKILKKVAIGAAVVSGISLGHMALTKCMTP